MKEYAIYPFQYMNITQSYDQGNHINHWQNSKDYSDKPWDEACQDSGRSYFVPQNDFRVEEVLGLGNSIVTNSVRLISVNKLTMPNGKTDYLKLTLSHMEENNLKLITKGQMLKKGTKILLEGRDGVTTGNHFHITANTGKYYGLLQNSNGSWCYTYQKSLLPQEAFYIDSKFTTIINKRGITFKNKPVISVAYYPKVSNGYTSIVDALKSINVNSSFSNRRKIAIKNNIKNYIGLPSQNEKMLDLLKQQRLIKV